MESFFKKKSPRTLRVGGGGGGGGDYVRSDSCLHFTTLKSEINFKYF